MPQSVPLDPTLQFVSGSGEAGDTTSSQLRGAERSRGGGAVSPGGGPLRYTSFPFPYIKLNLSDELYRLKFILHTFVSNWKIS